ncbi:MAG: Flp pilus assembly protein CpaB [Pyrinomonadaceae bacterium]
MRNKRFIVVLCGALFFGLLAAVSVGRYVSGAQAYTKNLNRIVVAKVAIPLGTKIVAEQVTTAQFPREAMPDGTFDSVDKLVGRVAVTQISEREPITETKLATEGTAGGLSAVIPEGYRAMTVKVDDVVGISGFIQPNTIVDVVVVIDPDKGANQDPISKIVLQNIKVLANGQNIDQPKNDREANSVKAVTLQVLPEQAEKLALASSEGKLQLVMRNSIDQDDSHTNGVNKRGLLSGDRAAPLPEPGALKSEQPKPAATSTFTPRRPRPSNADYSHRSSAPAASAPAAADAPAQAARPAAPTRPAVEMIEGSKKRSVDFP